MSNKDLKNNDHTKPNGDYKLYRNDVLKSRNDEYLMHSKLGRGTFGQVVKCLTKSSNEFVAVKILNNSPDYAEDVKNEIYMLKKILRKTPDKYNFVRKLDCFVHKSHMCIAFELLEIDLDTFMADHVFSAKAVGYILHQLLTGLVRLKQLGLIHTDVKPQNIMLVDSKQFPYRVKLIDFGSARKINAVAQGDYITTRDYRSPEIILGSPFTEKTDMWSLGCIAAELLINGSLYAGSSEYDVIRRICEMQGLPPNSMLVNGLNTSQYFILTEDGFQLKACQKFDTENITPNITRLQDIVSSNTRSDLEGKEWIEEIFDRSGITSLIEEMLQIDPEKRITAEESLNHSAVCDEHSWTGLERSRERET